MARNDPHELADDDDSIDALVDREQQRNRDGVESLRDTEAESGDEDEISDDFDMDDREARELGVELDDRDEPEPGLD